MTVVLIKARPMSPRQSDARQRVVAAAADMLARHGLNATSIREMAKHAGAPLGSTYHHFPGGKQQVVVEAVTLAGAQVSAALQRHLQPGGAGLAGFMAMWREILVRSDFRRGCPVMAVAIEEPLDAGGEDALQAAARVFADWEARLASFLGEHGHAPATAAALATLVIASLEGAIVLSRAQRSIAPFDRVSAQIEALAAAS